MTPFAKPGAKLKRCMLLAGCVFYALVAGAHHSAYLYDVTKKAEISGILQKVMFVNPHSKMTLLHKAENGTQEMWEVESSSTLMLKRRGWDFDKIKVGDEVTISGAPLRNGDKGLYMTGIKLKNGSEFGRTDTNIQGLD